MITSGLMSSNTDNWATPQNLFDVLNEEFHFTVDVCANKDNHKCEVYYTKETDGLSKDWEGKVWMNPPYGRTIGKWVHKASTCGADVVVALVPARTDTEWWQDCMKADEIRFVRGRLKFGGCKTSAPFPSAIVVWRKNPKYWERPHTVSMERP